MNLKKLGFTSLLATTTTLLTSVVHADEVPLGDIQGPGFFQTISSEPGKAAEKYISVLVGALTAIAGIAFISYFITGALNWITAAGDKQKMEQAKNAMTHAAIGIVAVVVAYFIASIVGTVLGIDILNPASLLQ